MTSRQTAQTPFFCALCTADVPPGEEKLEPLGANDGLVVVCRTCATETPIARDHERGYTGGTGDGGLSTQAISDALRNKQEDERYERDSRINSRRMLIPAPAMTPDERAIYEVQKEGERRRRTGAASYTGLRSRRQRTVLK